MQKDRKADSEAIAKEAEADLRPRFPDAERAAYRNLYAFFTRGRSWPTGWFRALTRYFRHSSAPRNPTTVSHDDAKAKEFWPLGKRHSVRQPTDAGRL